jgi:hypothetical protein
VDGLSSAIELSKAESTRPKRTFSMAGMGQVQHLDRAVTARSAIPEAGCELWRQDPLQAAATLSAEPSLTRGRLLPG